MYQRKVWILKAEHEQSAALNKKEATKQDYKFGCLNREKKKRETKITKCLICL